MIRNTISKMLGYLREHFDGVSLGLGIAVMITVLGITFFVLPNNLIFSDEGWYLCLLRDAPYDRGAGGTSFHLLFNNCFNNNIYAIRVACWLTQLLGAIVLALGITCWLSQYRNTNKGLLFLYSICVLYLGQIISVH